MPPHNVHRRQRRFTARQRAEICFNDRLDEAGRCRLSMEIALQARSSGSHLPHPACMDLRCGVKKNDDRHGKWRSKRGDIRPHNGL
ncbi:MAG: hypothetical protein GY820_39675 [Gammaproteobacteria bacterium]|nr:hypothetical protein [Gammaproteobacteria bacterium]